MRIFSLVKERFGNMAVVSCGIRVLLSGCLIAMLLSGCGTLSGHVPDPSQHPAPEQTAPDDRFSLTVMHLNDTHSHLVPEPGSLILDGTKTYVEMGGMARIKTKVDRIRSRDEHSLLLHAGDAVQGTLYFTRYQGEADMAALNLLGVEAMAVGNHEFDKGPKLPADLAGFADFPLLGANIDRTREPRLQGRIGDYVIRNIDGEQVGIVGLITPETAYVSTPGGTVGFADVHETAELVVNELQRAGVNKIIALTHEGFAQDLELARSVNGIDLIVGGHTHTLLGREQPFGLMPEGAYPVRVESPDGSPVYIVQAWSKSRILGVLRAAFDTAGEIVEASGEPVMLLGDTFRRKDGSGNKMAVTGDARQRILGEIAAAPELEVVSENPAMAELIAPYSEGIRAMKTTVVARVAKDLPHVRIPGRDRSGPRPECPHGSLVAPLVTNSMGWKSDANGLNVDFSLVNAGGVRTPLEAGALTVGDVYTLLPFGNTLVVLELSGAQVAAALEQGVDIALGGNNGAFPYAGNLRCQMDLNAPRGSRVTKIEIRRSPKAWEALDPEKIYRAVVSSYLAGGGDGYTVFKNASGYRYDTGFVDTEVFLDYAAAKQVLPPAPE